MLWRAHEKASVGEGKRKERKRGWSWCVQKRIKEGDWSDCGYCSELVRQVTDMHTGSCATCYLYNSLQLPGTLR